MKKEFDEFKLKNLYMEKELKIYNKDKKHLYNKKFKIGKKITNRSQKGLGPNSVTFGEEIENIEDNVLINIGECNSKQEKDIIIIIDFNIYNNKLEDNFNNKTYIIDRFIEQTQIILNTYLSNNDRLCVLIYIDEYKIICPLMDVNKIDINSFSKDLIYYKNKIFKEYNVTDEFDINIDEINDINNTEFNLGENNAKRIY